MDSACTKNFVFTNWSQTYTAYPELYFEPENANQLKSILKQAKQNGRKVKVVGAGLSPSDIACTSEYMISMKKFNKILDVDFKNHVVLVESGVLIRDLNNLLPQNDLALINQGSVCGQSIGGIIATGTHGTGGEFGSFASCLHEVTFMTVNGTTVVCSEMVNKELFSAISCHLGVLGIILSAKIKCKPAFSLHQVKQAGKLDDALKNLDCNVKSSMHYKFTWFPHTDNIIHFQTNQTNREHFESESSTMNKLLGYYLLEFCLWLATFATWMIPFINRVFFHLFCSGKKERVARSDNVFNFDCLFKQYVTEWAIPRKNTAIVLADMRTWLNSHPDVKVHFPVEVRFVKQDNIMMSPSGEGDVTYIGIISYRPYGKFVPHEQWWNFFENLVMKYHGKPHWAKAHEVDHIYLRKVYSNFDKFMEIRNLLDPDGMLLNDYWKRILN